MKMYCQHPQCGRELVMCPTIGCRGEPHVVHAGDMTHYCDTEHTYELQRALPAKRFTKTIKEYEGDPLQVR